jgi:histidinol dehydrogenase
LDSKNQAEFMINKFSTQDRDFDNKLNSLIAWESASNEEVRRSVEKIINDVKVNGDASVLDYTNKFDSVKAESISELIVSKERLKESFDNLAIEQKKCALNCSRKNQVIPSKPSPRVVDIPRR